MKRFLILTAVSTAIMIIGLVLTLSYLNGLLFVGILFIGLSVLIAIKALGR